MESAVIFIGISKDFSTPKRNMTIPNRKFVNIWNDKGMRNLRKPRNFSSEPKDIFQKWQDILKWRADSTFESIERDSKSFPNVLYSSQYKVNLVMPHYNKKGEERLKQEDYYSATNMIPKLVELLNNHPDSENYKGKIWFYLTDKPDDLSHIDGQITSNEPVNSYIFESIRSVDPVYGYIGYPAKQGYKFIDIHNTGIKDFHTVGMSKNAFNAGDRKLTKNRLRQLLESKRLGNRSLEEIKRDYDEKFEKFEKAKKKALNLIEQTTNEETKEKARTKIARLEREIKEEYYKMIAAQKKFERDLNRRKQNV